MSFILSITALRAWWKGRNAECGMRSAEYCAEVENEEYDVILNLKQR